jgi:hypothetical protein
VIFTEACLLKLAKDLHFTQRTPRKIDVVHLLAAVCEECIHGPPSCNNLAAQIQTASGGAPSRQAANLRRMKAKTETRGHHPSQAVLELMDWTLFITTIPATLAGFKEILAIYGLRWRIEIIFKAWKSHLKFPLLHRVSKLQLAILLKARLLIITACTNIVYGPLERRLRQNYDRRLSLLKFMRFLSKSPARLIRVLQASSLCEQENRVFHETLVRYCCCDKRKRQNYSEAWDALA